MGSGQRLRMMTSWALQSLIFHKTRALLTIIAVEFSTALVSVALITENERIPEMGVLLALGRRRCAGRRTSGS